MSVLWLVLIFLGLLVGTYFVAVKEGKHDAKQKYVDHRSSFIVRVIAAMLISFLFHKLFMNLQSSEFWVAFVFFIGIVAVLFWIPFDYVQNVERNIDEYFRGNTSFIDRVSKYIVIKGKQYVVWKFVLLGILLTFYIGGMTYWMSR